MDSCFFTFNNADGERFFESVVCEFKNFVIFFGVNLDVFDCNHRCDFHLSFHLIMICDCVCIRRIYVYVHIYIHTSYSRIS
jgi:hypothetical protein